MRLKLPPEWSTKNCSEKFAMFLKAWNFIKKRLQHRCVPVNIAKFFRIVSL